MQDNDDEKDIKQSDGSSGQDAPTCRCPHPCHLLGIPAKLHQHTDHVRVRSDGFNLSPHAIGPVGISRIPGVLQQCTSLVFLDLGDNECSTYGGVARLVRVLSQCAGLTCLNLSSNYIGRDGSEILTGLMAQCTALTHLDLSDTEIGREGGERFARVLVKCTTLSLLDLSCNGIGDVGKGRIRASCRGPVHRLVPTRSKRNRKMLTERCSP